MLKTGTAIMLDNAISIAKNSVLARYKKTAAFYFLSPYSPQLNPVKKFWSLLKRYLSKILPIQKSFDNALRQAFKVV